MPVIYKVSQEELDRWHAKKSVDRFLDNNKMFSHLGIDLLLIPEFLGIQLNATSFLGKQIAQIDKYEGRITISISSTSGINRKMALAIAYCLGIEYYNNFKNEKKKENYQQTFNDTYLDENGKISKKAYLFLGKEYCQNLINMPDDVKKLLVEELVDNAWSDYSCRIDESFMDVEDEDTKKYRYFAEELVSRDCTNRFLPEKGRNNSNYEF